MNLANLISKLKTIEEGIEVIGAPVGLPGMEHGQQDNVSMSVSLNGQGEGGVRNLMDILKGIEAASDDHEQPGEHPIMGDEEQFGPGSDHERDAPVDEFSELGPDHVADEAFDDDKEVWGNSAHGNSGHHTHGLDAVTFSGDDLNSKGKVSPVMRVPGTNTLRPVSEDLVGKLKAMYNEIKNESKINELSSKTLKSYGEKSSKDIDKRIHDSGIIYGKKASEEDSRKLKNRDTGIDRAIKKIGKEVEEGKTWDAVKKSAKDMWNGTDAENAAEEKTKQAYDKHKASKDTKYKVTHHPAGTKANQEVEEGKTIKREKTSKYSDEKSAQNRLKVAKDRREKKEHDKWGDLDEDIQNNMHEFMDTDDHGGDDNDPEGELAYNTAIRLKVWNFHRDQAAHAMMNDREFIHKLKMISPMMDHTKLAELIDWAISAARGSQEADDDYEDDLDEMSDIVKLSKLISR